jgi:hypothetical protein
MAEIGLTARHYQAATGLMHCAKPEIIPEKKSTIHAHAPQAARDLQELRYRRIVDDLQWLSWLYQTGWW